ncbi:MAG TPA: hypothetical protein VK348_05915, partial [Planctomycetota bacterium]|nr:hypothetical protein [Planctomycetota bacterium]
PDLEALTEMLGSCLGRIDTAAFLIQNGDDADDADCVQMLERASAELQELVSDLVTATDTPALTADLNRIVQRTVELVTGEVRFPVVVQLRLQPTLPQIAGSPSQISHAVQRALMLATTHAGHGGEVAIVTRSEEESVRCELQARGSGQDSSARTRAATLAEFLAGCGGRCRVDVDDSGALFLVLELPTAALLDDHGDG